MNVFEYTQEQAQDAINSGKISLADAIRYAEVDKHIWGAAVTHVCKRFADTRQLVGAYYEAMTSPFVVKVKASAFNSLFAIGIPRHHITKLLAKEVVVRMSWDWMYRDEPMYQLIDKDVPYGIRHMCIPHSSVVKQYCTHRAVKLYNIILKAQAAQS